MNIPSFSIPFIIILILGPIFSIEGVTPWFIAIYFIYKIIKYCKDMNISNKLKIKVCILNTIIGASLLILFNIMSNYINHTI